MSECTNCHHLLYDGLCTMCTHELQAQLDVARAEVHRIRAEREAVKDELYDVEKAARVELEKCRQERDDAFDDYTEMEGADNA